MVELLQPHLSRITFARGDCPSDYDVTYFALVVTGQFRSNQLQNQVTQQEKTGNIPTCPDVALQFGQDLNSSSLGLPVVRGVVMMHLSRAHDT